MTTPRWLGLFSGIAYAIGAVLVFLGLWLTRKELSGKATYGDLENLRGLLRKAGGKYGYAAAGLFLAGALLQVAASLVG